MPRIIDVVDHTNVGDEEFAWREPQAGSGDFRFGSRVIVGESQAAVSSRYRIHKDPPVAANGSFAHGAVGQHQPVLLVGNRLIVLVEDQESDISETRCDCRAHIVIGELLIRAVGRRLQ